MNTVWSRRRAVSWFLVGLLGTAAAGTACSPSAGTGSAPVVKLAFVTNNASEFWKIAAAGVRKLPKVGDQFVHDGCGCVLERNGPRLQEGKCSVAYRYFGHDILRCRRV